MVQDEGCQPKKIIDDYISDPNDDKTGFYIRSIGTRQGIKTEEELEAYFDRLRELAHLFSESSVVTLVSGGIIGYWAYFSGPEPKDLFIAIMAGGIGSMPFTLAYGILRELYQIYIKR